MTKRSRIKALVGLGAVAVVAVAAGLVRAMAPMSADALRALARTSGAAPVAEPAPQPEAMVALGRVLFFDPLLSGNRDVSCSTCHHPKHGTGDLRSLSVGTAARVVNGKRMPQHEHGITPRNAPAIFDLDQDATRSLFWDGRLERQDDGSIALYELSAQRTNLPRIQFEPSLTTLSAAQAMFPVLARNEMRGHPSDAKALSTDNELASVSDGDFDAVWRLITKRLLAVEEYREHFRRAYPDVAEVELRFSHAARAIGAFEIASFTLTGSPWDRFLSGDDGALTPEARHGAELFYGAAGCAACHSGSRFTDAKLRNLGVVPMTRGPSVNVFVDHGAAHRSHGGDEARFKFRTPPLRNVAVTGPWMHNGCYTTLEATVRHHLDPRRALATYDDTQLSPEFRQQVHRTAKVKEEVLATLDPLVNRRLDLSDREVRALVAFLTGLTSPKVTELASLVPERVPSGLALVDP